MNFQCFKSVKIFLLGSLLLFFAACSSLSENLDEPKEVSKLIPVPFEYLPLSIIDPVMLPSGNIKMIQALLVHAIPTGSEVAKPKSLSVGSVEAGLPVDPLSLALALMQIPEISDAIQDSMDPRILEAAEMLGAKETGIAADLNSIDTKKDPENRDPDTVNSLENKHSSGAVPLAQDGALSDGGSNLKNTKNSGESLQKMLEDMLEKEPNNRIAHQLLARSLLQGGDIQKAMDSLQKIDADETQSAAFYHQLARYEYEQKRPESSLELLKQSIKKDPASALYHYDRAIINSQQKRLKAASQDYEQADRNWQAKSALPKSDIYYGQGVVQLQQKNHKKAQELFSKARKQATDSSRYNQAESVVKGRQKNQKVVSAAFVNPTRLIKKNPKNQNKYSPAPKQNDSIPLQELIAQPFKKIASITKRFSLKELFANKAAIGPIMVILVLLMMVIGFIIWMPQESKQKIKTPVSNSKIDLLSKEITLHPDDYLLYKKRAALYEAISNYDLAIRDYEKAIEINPRFFLGYKKMGIMHFNNQVLDQALSAFQILKSKQEDDIICFQYCGWIYDEQAKYELAINEFVKVNQLYNRYTQIYSEKQLIRIDLDEYDRLVVALKQCQPEQEELRWMNKGQIKLVIGDWIGAISTFSKVIQLNQANKEAYFLRGTAKEKNEDLKGANLDYEKA